MVGDAQPYPAVRWRVAVLHVACKRLSIIIDEPKPCNLQWCFAVRLSVSTLPPPAARVTLRMVGSPPGIGEGVLRDVHVDQIEAVIAQHLAQLRDRGL